MHNVTGRFSSSLRRVVQIMLTRRTLMVLSVIAISSVSGASSQSDPVNHSRGGIAIRGYDPVAYFTDSKPLKGDSSSALLGAAASGSSHPLNTGIFSHRTRSNTHPSMAGTA